MDQQRTIHRHVTGPDCLNERHADVDPAWHLAVRFPVALGRALDHAGAAFGCRCAASDEFHSVSALPFQVYFFRFGSSAINGAW